jgi:hypothetical protein
MREPNYPLFLYAFFAICFVFGFGYYWVSQDINKNHGIVKMGMIGKAGLFFLFTFYYLIGDIHLFIELILFDDLVFAAFFAEFLMRAKKVKQF